MFIEMLFWCAATCVVIVALNFRQFLYTFFRTKEQSTELTDLEYQLYTVKTKSNGIFMSIINDIHQEKIRKVRRDIIRNTPEDFRMSVIRDLGE